MSQSQNNGTGDQQGDENVEPSIKRRKIRNGFGNDSNTLLGRELVVYDNHSRCLLTEGEYELVLSEISESPNPIIRGSPRKNGSWENINIDKSDKVLRKLFYENRRKDISRKIDSYMPYFHEIKNTFRQYQKNVKFSRCPQH